MENKGGDIIFKKLIKWFSNRRRKGFQKEYIDFWPAYECYCNRDETKFLMKYFDNHNYVRYKVGDIVPMTKRDGMTSYYKIVKISNGGSSYGDYAMWDDNKIYHLVFDHVEVITLSGVA